MEAAMLTVIGILGLVGLLGSIYIRKCLVITKVATYSVVFSWGAKPIAVLEPPWNLVFWPFNQVKATITTEVKPHNMTGCKITCKIEDPNAKPGSPYQKAVGELETGEISLSYQFHFWQSSEIRRVAPRVLIPIGFGQGLQLQSFFNFVSIKADGTICYDTLHERFKDFLQGLLAEKSKELDIYEAINFSKDYMKEIKVELQEMLWELGLPIRVVSLERNSPFHPVDALGKAIEARAALVVGAQVKVVEAESARQVSVITANAAKEVAVIEVETAKARGDQEVVRVQKLLEAYGLTALPPAERFAKLLDLQSLEVYRQMASSPSSKTFVIPSMVLSQIGGALSTLSGGRS